MPVGYYLIPMTSGPYSRANPQRPQYVDEIRCNWTGHNVDLFTLFVCKVNTTAEKHADLSSRAGVFPFPEGVEWDTVISTLAANLRNRIRTKLTQHDIPYDPSETIGELVMRVINIGLWHDPDTVENVTAVDALFSALPPGQQNKITALCTKWALPPPANTETVSAMSKRMGPRWWYGPSLAVREF